MRQASVLSSTAQNELVAYGHDRIQAGCGLRLPPPLSLALKLQFIHRLHRSRHLAGEPAIVAGAIWVMRFATLPPSRSRIMKLRYYVWFGVAFLGAVALLARNNISEAGPSGGAHFGNLGPSSPSSVPIAPALIAARLDIRLPEKAHLWVEGQDKGTPGASYLLISPPLEVGFTYTYSLRAQWQERGSEVTRTRAVKIRAGESVQVDLATAGPDETTIRTPGSTGPR
jgi:uncharacterized protein (TIGR03000 family)